jgi:hypothetical protein
LAESSPKEENPSHQPSSTTLRFLVDETARLHRELLRLLEVYAGDGSAVKIFQGILSPRWRPEAGGTVHGPFDRRYWECAVWAAEVREYCKRVQRYFRSTDESDARIKRLPLAEPLDLPARELAELLEDQLAVLRRWSEAEESETNAPEDGPSSPARRHRSDDRVRQELIREILRCKEVKLSHLEICKRLDTKKFDTPKQTKWSHLTWVAAYKDKTFRASVQKWLSGVQAD